MIFNISGGHCVDFSDWQYSNFGTIRWHSRFRGGIQTVFWYSRILHFDPPSMASILRFTRQLYVSMTRFPASGVKQVLGGIIVVAVPFNKVLSKTHSFNPSAFIFTRFFGSHVMLLKQPQKYVVRCAWTICFFNLTVQPELETNSLESDNRLDIMWKKGLVKSQHNTQQVFLSTPASISTLLNAMLTLFICTFYGHLR